MSTARVALRMTGISMLAAGAGGLVVGLMIVAITAVSASPPANIHPLMLIGLSAILMAAAGIGFVFGLILGFLPMLTLAVVLTSLKKLPPFHHVLVWALVGAVCGLVIHRLYPWDSAASENGFPWSEAWPLGGGVAAAAYWFLAFRFFARPRLPDPRPSQE
jgi:hypothetical protein